MKSLALCFVVAASTFALAPVAARAAMVTETYDFSLTNFVDVGGNLPPPITAISGSFTLTFDPGIAYDNQTAGLTVNFLTDTLISSPIGFDTFPGAPYFISIGGIANDADFIAFGVDDFALSLQFTDANSLGSPQYALCNSGFQCGTAAGTTFASGYTLAGFPNDGWLAQSAIASAAPEPGTWTLMAVGLGLVGAALRGRRKQASIVACA